ncbi:MAG: maf protein [Polaromonas sp.]|jgi:septum formation protein|nr:maf protein [Polaromonas sp.]
MNLSTPPANSTADPESRSSSDTRTAQRPLILASGSAYRKELLQRLRMPFTVEIPDVDESPLAGETPMALATRLALAKARAVAARFPHAVVIGSDQVADLKGTPLGKPGNHLRAVAQLRQMSGQAVAFQTAVAVVCLQSGFKEQALATVNVKFRDLDDEDIENYLQAEQPYNCAGSAKSEGLGIALLASIDSDDPTALIGLPLIRTCNMLRSAGIRLLGAPSGSGQ